MLPPKSYKNQVLDHAYGRKLRCTKCGVVMKDSHPMLVDGEFWHLDNGCANGGSYYDWELNPARGSRRGTHVSGIEQVHTKRHVRARKRGAKLASKHRPK